MPAPTSTSYAIRTCHMNQYYRRLRPIRAEWATLAQDRAGWLKLVTKAPFDIGKPQLRPPRCDTRDKPEEKRRFLARRAQETEQRRAIFNAETDAEET